MKILKPGDPCPCCGQPIKTKDRAVLMLLSWIAAWKRLPTAEEIAELLRIAEEGGGLDAAAELGGVWNDHPGCDGGGPLC